MVTTRATSRNVGADHNMNRAPDLGNLCPQPSNEQPPPELPTPAEELRAMQVRIEGLTTAVENLVRANAGRRRKKQAEEDRRSHRNSRIISMGAEDSHERSSSSSSESQADSKGKKVWALLDILDKKVKKPKWNQAKPSGRFQIRALPFTDDVLTTPIVGKFKQPAMEQYSGNSDPWDHLATYDALMAIQATSDAMKCQDFSATLKGSARIWFSGLPPRSIPNFKELGDRFVNHFRSSGKTQRESSTLLSVVQKRGETLGDYFKRFIKEARDIPGLNQPIAMAALLKGHKDDALADDVALRPLKDYAELQDRFVGFIRREEARLARNGGGETSKRK